MKSIARTDCPLCEGTGGYSYDENHGTTCKLCCPHKSFYLQGQGHPHPGEITCGACGYEPRNEPWQVFNPETFQPELGADYRVLWRKVVKPTPFMPEPKRDEIVREDKVVFGRSTKQGRIALVDLELRSFGAKSNFEINPEWIIAICRLI